MPLLQTLWAALAYAAASLTLAYPALAGRFLVSPISDQYLGGFPVRAFAARMFHETGHIPLWNPYLFAGMPYVASMNGDIFYPTFLLRLILPPDVGMTWGMILHLFLAGLATYWFLRAIGLTFGGALVGGMAYMMGGQVASLVSAGHDGKLFISALFPVMLLLLTWGVRDGKRWAWGLVAIVSGLGVLTPHPQLYQYLLLASGAWVLILAFGSTPALTRPPAFRRLGLAFASIVLGMLIGAIQYVPVMEYVSWSPRAAGKGYDYATSYSMPPEELLNTYLPQFSGLLDHYWGRNGIHFHSEYVGAVVLFLAIAGFGAMGMGQGAGTPNTRRGGSAAGSRGMGFPGNKARWFWLGLLVVSLLWALGGYTPFYHLVYALVPGAKFFRAPSTIFFVTTFAVAVFAAYGAERLLRGEISRRYLIGWGIAAGVIALLAASGGLTSAFANLSPDVQLDAVEANRGAVALGGFRSLFFVVLAMGIAVLVAKRGEARMRRVALPALLLLLTADCWTIQRLYWKFSPPARELYASNAIVEHLHAEKEPGRVFTLYGRNAAPHDPFLAGDAFMLHGVRLVTGYHGNEIGRYDRLWDKENGGQQLGNPVFWQLANVKWFVSSDSQPALPSLQRVMGPVTDAAGSSLYLFRVPGDNPPAWVVPVMMKQPDNVVEDAVHDPRFPARSLALFDPEAPVQGATNLTTVPAPLTLTATTPVYAPGHITVELSAPAPAGSALVVSENYYPGWKATVDGKPTAAYRADLSLMGVPLPAGARKVELRFESAAYERGRMITLITLGIAILSVLGGFFMARSAGAIGPASANGVTTTKTHG